MADRYTKAVLTVIAVALVWLCLWGPGPRGGMAVNIAEVDGKRLHRLGDLGGIPVDVQSFSTMNTVSVNVNNTVPVNVNNWSEAALYLK